MTKKILNETIGAAELYITGNKREILSALKAKIDTALNELETVLTSPAYKQTVKQHGLSDDTGISLVITAELKVGSLAENVLTGRNPLDNPTITTAVPDAD